MINIAASVYPNGLEKARNCSNANNTILPELKEEAIKMLERGITMKYVSIKLGIPVSTMACWKKTGGY